MASFALFFAGIFGLLSIALGAYGAHGLKNMDPHLMASFETAVRYALMHALLLGLYSVLAQKSSSWVLTAGILASVAGVTLFSGSIIGRVLTGKAWLSQLAPYGGTSLMIAWALLAVFALILSRN